MVCSIRSSALCLLLLTGLAAGAPASEVAARAAALEAKKAFDLGDYPRAIEQYTDRVVGGPHARLRTALILAFPGLHARLVPGRVAAVLLVKRPLLQLQQTAVGLE